MNLTAILIDDEYHALEVMREYVKLSGSLNLLAEFTRPLEALAWMEAHGAPALVLADIDMPRLSGLALARLIGGRSQIVFTTSHREFGPEAFELGATDYLLKPVSFERFLQMVGKLKNVPAAEPAPGTEPAEFVLVKSGVKGHLKKIRFSDMLYVESAQNYIEICTPGGKVTTYLTMTEFEQYLGSDCRFRRIHRSFIVNTDHLQALEPVQVTVSNGHILPVGRAYRQELFSSLEAFVLNSHRR